MPRPNYITMSKKDLIKEIRRRDHQVSRRGCTIGGLYASLEYALNENPMTYPVSYTTGGTPTEREDQLKRELSSAREHVKRIMQNNEQRKKCEKDDMPITQLNHNSKREGKEEESHKKMREFGCNICFENYDDETRCPMAFGCGHLLCGSCYIKKNIQDTGKNPTCPSCRADIKTVLPLFVSLIE